MIINCKNIDSFGFINWGINATKKIVALIFVRFIKLEFKKAFFALYEFRNKFGSEMVDMLHKMGDFYLFEFTPFYGEAVFGFGKAYNLGGDNFEEFVERTNNSSGHGKK